jgi:hypothetical protein
VIRERVIWVALSGPDKPSGSMGPRFNGAAEEVDTLVLGSVRFRSHVKSDLNREMVCSCSARAAGALDVAANPDSAAQILPFVFEKRR